MEIYQYRFHTIAPYLNTTESFAGHMIFRGKILFNFTLCFKGYLIFPQLLLSQSDLSAIYIFHNGDKLQEVLRSRQNLQ